MGEQQKVKRKWQGANWSLLSTGPGATGSGIKGTL